jgi:hypothetical protein
VAKLPDFQRRQYEFAAHIRDPGKNAAPPGVEDRRMAIYRDLFFNNLRNLLGSTFPVLKKLSGKERWAELIREFMAKHESHTPYFLEIPKEFLAFLETEHATRADDFPFLLELAHYEWVELALSVATDGNDLTGVDPDGDLLEGAPVISALAWPLAYRFPVHRISTDYLPQEPGEQPTYLVVYRAADNEIGFMELNAVTAGLLDKILNNTEQKSGRALLVALAGEINFDPDVLIEHGSKALAELRAADILLGTVTGAQDEADSHPAAKLA